MGRGFSYLGYLLLLMSRATFDGNYVSQPCKQGLCRITRMSASAPAMQGEEHTVPEKYSSGAIRIAAEYCKAAAYYYDTQSSNSTCRTAAPREAPASVYCVKRLVGRSEDMQIKVASRPITVPPPSMWKVLRRRARLDSSKYLLDVDSPVPWKIAAKGNS